MRHRVKKAGEVSGNALGVAVMGPLANGREGIMGTPFGPKPVGPCLKVGLHNGFPNDFDSAWATRSRRLGIPSGRRFLDLLWGDTPVGPPRPIGPSLPRLVQVRQIRPHVLLFDGRDPHAVHPGYSPVRFHVFPRSLEHVCSPHLVGSEAVGAPRIRLGLR